MRLNFLTVLVSLLVIGIISISGNSIYGQEVKEYNDDSFSITFEYPKE